MMYTLKNINTLYNEKYIYYDYYIRTIDRTHICMIVRVDTILLQK